MSTATAAAPASNLALRPKFKEKYDHYIGSEWVAPRSGEYFDNVSPIDGKVFTKAARGNAKEGNKALPFIESKLFTDEDMVNLSPLLKIKEA